MQQNKTGMLNATSSYNLTDFVTSLLMMPLEMVCNAFEMAHSCSSSHFNSTVQMLVHLETCSI